MARKKTHNEFEAEFRGKNTHVYLLGKYVDQKTKIKVKCKKCGHVYDSYSTNLLKNKQCGVCTGHVVCKGINDLNTTHKDISKLLLDKETGYKYSYGSKHITDWKCPHCGNIIKNKTILEVVRYGLGCNMCSDGISYPEKVVSNFLSFLNINYKYQLNSSTYKWCKKYKYDFYIEEFNMIIEVMGSNHYTGRFQYIGGKNLEEEILNDEVKRDLAIKNNINNYIQLNCKKSNINWIKDSIIKSNILDIFRIKENEIDWKLIHNNSLNSYIVDALKLHKDGLTPKEISQRLSLHAATVYRYIKNENNIKLQND